MTMEMDPYANLVIPLHLRSGTILAKHLSYFLGTREGFELN